MNAANLNRSEVFCLLLAKLQFGSALFMSHCSDLRTVLLIHAKPITEESKPSN